MAGSDAKPTVILVGGDGRATGVPRHILHLTKALENLVDLQVVSDIDRGGYTALREHKVKHVEIAGLQNSLNLCRVFRATRAVFCHMKQRDPDLVWIHARLQILLFRLLLACRVWRPRGAVVFTHHGLPFGRGYHPVLHLLGKSVEKLLLTCCPPHDLVFLNGQMANALAQDVGASLSRHRVHVLNNCSDLGCILPKRQTGKRRLVMTGRTGRQKDLDFAARFLAKLPPHFHLTLCGPGTDEISFKDTIRALVSRDVFSRISFVGPVRDVRPVLQSADAYLLTSRYEGVPIGALEAFEVGLPVILRDFDGAQALVDMHPCALLIGQDSKVDASAVETLLARYDRNELLFRSATREVWQNNWSPQIFDQRARYLVQQILRRSGVQVAFADFVRGAPTLHPDRHKNEDARPPAPPPYYTDVGPSAESASQQ